MITVGLKLTHDAAVALFDDERLVFSVEMEKLDNNPRYSEITDSATIVRILADAGYTPEDVHRWAVDGWDGSVHGSTEISSNGVNRRLFLAPYRETDSQPEITAVGRHGSLEVGQAERAFNSHVHIAGHVFSAYMTSAAAARGEDSIVMVWDGGLFPRLYDVHTDGTVINGGALFPLIGHTYATVAHHFGPYKRTSLARTVDDLSVAGKLMAYVALGKHSQSAREVFERQLQTHFFGQGPIAATYREEVGGFGSNSEPSLNHLNRFFADCAEELKGAGVSDEDILATFHQLMEDLLVSAVRARVLEWKGQGPWNLCFVGGCALNIKWNSALRVQGDLFAEVWVPPFPNDSGSAIGTAATTLFKEGVRSLSWTVHSGPEIGVGDLDPTWSVTACDVEQLAELFVQDGRPVTVLDGRAELGPRALGARSIIAPAWDPTTKDELNRIKRRESYRPVAPICLEEHAPRIFLPGTPDPYMLFDHELREEWAARIPAVVHLDGTARLQTVDAARYPFLHRLLTRYHELTGIPVLCNTSANFNGSGFFPDVASAMRWGQTPFIWSDGSLYTRPS